MNFIRKLLTIVPATALIGACMTMTAPALAATNCTVTVTGSTNDVGKTTSRVQLSNNNTDASVTMTLSGPSTCTSTLTLASWEAPNANFNLQNINTQTLYDHTTETFGPGTLTLGVKMVDCYYQIDLVPGSSPTAPDGTANYGNGKVLAWAQGGTQLCNQPKPTLTCNQLTVTQSANRTVTLNNLDESVTNGATFKNVVIDWGDNTPTLTTNSVASQTHQYTADTTYTIVATAHFDVNGHDESKTSIGCSPSVTFIAAPPTPTPPTSPAPTTLVNTGPGNMVVLFVATALFGAIAYRLYSLRYAD